MTTPLRSVLGAMADGASSRGAIVAATGLSPDVVDAAIDHLVRMGHIRATALTSGCAEGGCGSCPSGAGSAAACSAGGASLAGNRAVLVGLSLRRTEPA